jgi:hypothetical protein
MKINKEQIPIAMEAPGTVMRNLKGFGGMTVGFNQLPAGTDFGPLLQGLKNNSCQCPHWGYMIEGELLSILPSNHMLPSNLKAYSFV